MTEQPINQPAGQGPDHGPTPYVLDIEAATLANENFRTTAWTGQYLQMTLMTIPPGGEIGAEVHDDHDQFLRLEAGRGRAMIGEGPEPEPLALDQVVEDDWAVFVPAGHWHNVVTVGEEPMRLYSLYGPPDHVPGTVHPTKADADADPNEQH